MRNFKKLIAMMLMLASVFFFACDDDDDDKTLSPEETKTELSTLNADMSGYLEEMTNSEGIAAMEALMTMPDPFAGDSKTNARTSVILNIKKYLLPVNPEKTKSTFEVSGFDFDNSVGTYTWNPTYQSWDIIHGDPNNKIIINFPTEGSATNDATITLHNYEEVTIQYYDDYYQEYYEEYTPTDILADLYINNIKVVGIDLAASWVTSGDNAGEPTSFDINVYLTPFTFTGNFDNTSNAASIDFAINYNSEQIFSAGVDATFTSNGMDDPLTIGGYIQLLNVKVDADVDVRNINAIFTALDEGTSTYATMDELIDAVNDEIDAVVYVDGVKAANIEIEYNELNQEEPITIVLVFSDSSIDEASQYFEGFISDIEDFFYFLDDIYGDW